VGPIAGHRINAPIKLAILTVIETSQNGGVSARRSCSLLMIAYRRVVRWQGCRRYGLGLVDGAPGPKEAWHRLLSEEVACITRLACSPEHADLSHRILAVTAWEQGRCFVSFSTVYRVLKAQGLMTARGHRGAHNGRSLAPVRKKLTGANQRWCWDISYLPTGEKGIYLFLYLVLDEYSRKALAWRISWVQTSAEASQLLEIALAQENVLDLPDDRRPEVINDRGRQMKAKPIQRLFEDHAMPQLFARPRTPDDNPFIESAFSTAKRAPEYPGRFRDDREATAYFEKYFDWYNHRHDHSGIDYVTPAQAHQGLRDAIVRRRSVQQQAQRQRRRAENQRISPPQQQNNRPPALLPVA
jgi:putative transposase